MMNSQLGALAAALFPHVISGQMPGVQIPPSPIAQARLQLIQSLIQGPGPAQRGPSPRQVPIPTFLPPGQPAQAPGRVPPIGMTGPNQPAQRYTPPLVPTPTFQGQNQPAQRAPGTPVPGVRRVY